MIYMHNGPQTTFFSSIKKLSERDKIEIESEGERQTDR